MAVLPFGRAGIVSASMLGLGRALGETMAVAMVLSPPAIVTFHLLTSQNPNDDRRQHRAAASLRRTALDINALIATGLVLFVVTLAVNMHRPLRSSTAARNSREPTDDHRHRPPPTPVTLDRRPAAAWTDVGDPALAASRCVLLGHPGLRRRHRREFVRIAGWSGRVLFYRRRSTAVSSIVEGAPQGQGPARHRRSSPAAFIIALLPLVSLVWTVLVQRPRAVRPAASSPSSMRNVVGEGGGALHAIVGTLLITGIAAAHLGADRPADRDLPGRVRRRARLARAITFLVDVMTGIPSIVAGLFAYALFALFFGPGIRVRSHRRRSRCPC